MEYVQDGLLGYGKVWSQLALLMIDGTISVALVKGGMRIPNRDVPCIFVGPGTGVAPMRAIIEERIRRGSNGALHYFQTNHSQSSCIWKS